MKHLDEIFYFVVIAIIFGPWALLFVDGSWLFLTGHVLTSVPWDTNRVMIASIWPFLCAMIAAPFTGG